MDNPFARYTDMRTANRIAFYSEKVRQLAKQMGDTSPEGMKRASQQLAKLKRTALKRRGNDPVYVAVSGLKEAFVEGPAQVARTLSRDAQKVGMGLTEFATQLVEEGWHMLKTLPGDLVKTVLTLGGYSPDYKVEDTMPRTLALEKKHAAKQAEWEEADQKRRETSWDDLSKYLEPGEDPFRASDAPAVGTKGTPEAAKPQRKKSTPKRRKMLGGLI